MSKGSARRPRAVATEAFERAWERTFEHQNSAPAEDHLRCLRSGEVRASDGDAADVGRRDGMDGDAAVVFDV